MRRPLARLKRHYQARNSLYTYCGRYMGNVCGQFARPLLVVKGVQHTTCQRCRATYARYHRVTLA